MRITLAALWFMTWLSWPVWAVTLQGKVIGVSDGDTITVLDASRVARKVRLAGIDAPEKSQAFGDRSKQHLSELVFGKTVDVDWRKTDKYGRIIGKVIVGGQDANLSQLQSGLAWHYKAYESEQSIADRDAYAHAESGARVKRTGLWQDQQPTAPWVFRHGSEASSAKVQKENHQFCPCSSDFSCPGPRGGRYCFTSGGKKKYL